MTYDGLPDGGEGIVLEFLSVFLFERPFVGGAIKVDSRICAHRGRG